MCRPIELTSLRLGHTPPLRPLLITAGQVIIWIANRHTWICFFTHTPTETHLNSNRGLIQTIGLFHLCCFHNISLFMPYSLIIHFPVDNSFMDSDHGHHCFYTLSAFTTTRLVSFNNSILSLQELLWTHFYKTKCFFYNCYQTVFLQLFLPPIRISLMYYSITSNTQPSSNQLEATSNKYQ